MFNDEFSVCVWCVCVCVCVCCVCVCVCVLFFSSASMDVWDTFSFISLRLTFRDFIDNKKHFQW